MTTFPALRGLNALMSAAALSLSLACAPAAAVDVVGVKLDDTAKVGGKELKLNGAGVRVRAVFKVYAIAVYLPKHETTVDGVMNSQGPRRVTLSMMRAVSGEELGQAFMAGINSNTDKDERKKFINQIAKLGEVFANNGDLKVGDLIHLDWVPGTGVVMTFNGKQVAEPIPELAFYNAMLRIWLGDKPVDGALKPVLLGQG
jgi:hypothetical protein